MGNCTLWRQWHRCFGRRVTKSGSVFRALLYWAMARLRSPRSTTHHTLAMQCNSTFHSVSTTGRELDPVIIANDVPCRGVSVVGSALIYSCSIRGVTMHVGRRCVRSRSLAMPLACSPGMLNSAEKSGRIAGVKPQARQGRAQALLAPSVCGPEPLANHTFMATQSLRASTGHREERPSVQPYTGSGFCLVPTWHTRQSGSLRAIRFLFWANRAFPDSASILSISRSRQSRRRCALQPDHSSRTRCAPAKARPPKCCAYRSTSSGLPITSARHEQVLYVDTFASAQAAVRRPAAVSHSLTPLLSFLLVNHCSSPPRSVA